MLRHLPLLVLSVFPLLSFGASAFLSSVVLHKDSLACGAALGMHTLLYGGLLFYASMIGSTLIEAHQLREPAVPLEIVCIKCFFFFLCVSSAWSVIDMLCLVHLHLFRHLFVWALLVVLDVLYLVCASDIQKEMFPKQEDVLDALKEASSDSSSSNSEAHVKAKV